MNRTLVTLVVGIVLAGPLSGCRDYPRGTESVDHSLMSGESEGLWSSGVALGTTGRTIRAELVIAEAARGPRERLQFVATEADSLSLVASWAGLDPKEVVRQNDHLEGLSDIRGRLVSLELDPATAARFRGLRAVHLARWKLRDGKGLSVVEVIEHQVRKGEALPDLLRQYPTTEDLLARENGYLKLHALREGQKVRIPLTMAVSGKGAPGP